MRRLALGILMLATALPGAAHASTEAPRCIFGVLPQGGQGVVFIDGTLGVASGTPTYLLWVSTPGSTLVRPDGVSIPNAGVISTIPGAGKYQYTVTKDGLSSSCSVTFSIIPPLPSALQIAPVPLLTGGTVLPNTSVPVSYLYVGNTGTSTTALEGFTLIQSGSAPTSTLLAFSAIDDTGMLKGSTIGTTSTLFSNDGTVFVPIHAVLAPGQQRLFTIRARVGNIPAWYVGTQLQLMVTGIQTISSVTGHFPIFGTVWTLGN